METRVSINNSNDTEMSYLLGHRDENQELAAQNENEGGFFGRLNSIGSAFKAVAAIIAKATKYGAQYAWSNPLSTILSIVTSAPSAVNALAAPSGINPANIGSIWWNSISGFTKTYSVLCMLSSFLINLITHLLVLPLAWHKFHGAILDMRKGPKQAATNSLALYFSGFGALAAGAIGYSAFQWLPYGKFTAIPIALANALINFATRFISMIVVLTLLTNMLLGHSRLQNRFADTLAHINDNYRELIQLESDHIIAAIQQNHLINSPFDDEQYQKMTRKLSRKLIALTQLHSDLIDEPSTRSTVFKYSSLALNGSFALMCASAGFITFAQKGFDGVNIIANLLANNPLDSMQAVYKGLIGASPGFSTAIFYGKNSFDFVHMASSLISYLYVKPVHLFTATGLLAANGFASASMNSVAQGIVNNPLNMFGLTADTLGIVYIATTTTAGALANTNNTMNKAFLTAPTTTQSDIALPLLISYLRDADSHRITPKTAAALRKFNLFQANGRLSNNTSVQVQNIPVDFANLEL
jgi:hypothetical protein